MVVVTPDSRLTVGIHYAELLLLAAAFCVWFLQTEKLDEWVPLMGSASMALQVLAWAVFNLSGSAGAWNVLTLAGLPFLLVAAIGALATIRRAKPWYQRVFELTLIVVFLSEAATFGVYLFTRLHG